MKSFEQDLSQGNVVTQLIRFSIPFLISNLLQAAYSVVDMIVVGKFAGAECMAGVNISGQVNILIINMVVGLSAGATVLIGQYLGAGMKEKLKNTIGTLLTTLIVLGAALTTILILLRVPVLTAMNTPKEAFEPAMQYFIITTAGIIFTFGYNALSAILRGMGDSTRPLIFVAIACVLNIALDLVLVAVFHMGAAGAAYATVFSQAISMILCIIYLKKHDFVFDFNLKSFGFHSTSLKMLLKLGVPTSLQNVLTTFSFIILTSLINNLGVDASAAVGAVAKFNTFAILPAIAMCAAVSAMVAQNIGAGKIDRAKQTMYVGIAISLVVSGVIFVIAKLFPEQIMRIFIDKQEVIEAGKIYLNTYSYDYFFVPFTLSINGLFIGSGHTSISLVNGILSSLFFRVPFAYILGVYFNMGLYGFALGAVLATVVTAIIEVVLFFIGKWKKAVVIKPAS